MVLIWPLPGTVTASIVSSSPPTSVQARPGDRADLVLFLAHAVAESANAEELAEVFGRQLDLLDLAFEDLAKRLARDLGQLALERTNAGFARVVADDRRAARRR